MYDAGGVRCVGSGSAVVTYDVQGWASVRRRRRRRSSSSSSSSGWIIPVLYADQHDLRLSQQVSSDNGDDDDDEIARWAAST